MAKLWKLTPALALATALGLLIIGSLIVAYAERSYTAQKIREASVQAEILASTVTAAVSFDDRQAAQEYVNALRVNPEVQAAAVYGADNALIASYLRAGAIKLPARPETRASYFEGDRLVVTEPIAQGGNVLRQVYLQVNAEPAARRWQRYGIMALLITLVSVIVGVLGVAQSTLKRANAELGHRATQLAEANTNLQTQINEREKAEAALRQSQKMETIGQLTGGVAHDFNNLLQAIAGGLDAARRRIDRAGLPEGQVKDIHRFMDMSIQGVDRAAGLTQRLLAFSRRQPLAPKQVDVNKLVGGMSDLLRRTLGENIAIETVFAGGLWRISADNNQLESALLNLAVNARDAMPEGGKLTIETANTYLDEFYAGEHDDLKPGQYVMVAMTDTGMGMNRDTLAKVFEPFFTTKDVGHGTGLGLSQVYGFIKQSGGHIKIYSEVGQGTTVKLYFARLMEVTDDAQAIAEERHLPTGEKSETILIVEDEPAVRAANVEMLRELGYGVLQAPDGKSALQILETEPGIRLLFTDVGLPGGINGRQLADEARRRWPHLKVLYTTGYARNAIVHQGRLDPGIELIGKPFTYAALAKKIRQTLEGDSAS